MSAAVDVPPKISFASILIDNGVCTVTLVIPVTVVFRGLVSPAFTCIFRRILTCSSSVVYNTIVSKYGAVLELTLTAFMTTEYFLKVLSFCTLQYDFNVFKAVVVAFFLQNVFSSISAHEDLGGSTTTPNSLTFLPILNTNTSCVCFSPTRRVDDSSNGNTNIT